MKIYIAGRIAGDKQYKAKFREAERKLSEAGHIALNPATQPAGLSNADYIRVCFAMTPTITRIRDTNEFITAVSVKERIAACLSVFIKKTLPTGGIGRGAVRQADGQVDYAGKHLGPGMIMEMNAGDDAQVVDPKGSATDATAFLKTQQGLIGAGQGLSYEAVSRDMTGATYSSARQNAIEDESTYAEDIELLTDFMALKTTVVGFLYGGDGAN